MAQVPKRQDIVSKLDKNERNQFDNAVKVVQEIIEKASILPIQIDLTPMNLTVKVKSNLIEEIKKAQWRVTEAGLKITLE